MEESNFTLPPTSINTDSKPLSTADMASTALELMIVTGTRYFAESIDSGIFSIQRTSQVTDPPSTGSSESSTTIRSNGRAVLKGPGLAPQTPPECHQNQRNRIIMGHNNEDSSRWSRGFRQRPCVPEQSCSPPTTTEFL